MDDIQDFTTSLLNFDDRLFPVLTQTSPRDRRALMLIQTVVRNANPHYVYLEVGSHLGGTLTPHLLDPACRHVFSVDKRPLTMPDERGVMFDYDANSTQRMLATLQAKLPPGLLAKLTTFDGDLSEAGPADIPLPVDLAFIDGEHTTVAAFRDFLTATRFLAPSHVVAFHDASIVFDALQNIECLLRHQGTRFRSFFLQDTVFVIATGHYAEIGTQVFERGCVDRHAFIDYARKALWRTIAENAKLMRDGEIGHAPG